MRTFAWIEASLTRRPRSPPKKAAARRDAYRQLLATWSGMNQKDVLETPILSAGPFSIMASLALNAS